MYSRPLPLEVCLKHCGQRGCDSSEPFDKLLVKSTQSEELSNFMNRSRRRPTSNDLDLFGDMCTPSLSMMYPQKGTGLWKNVDLSMQGKRWC